MKKNYISNATESTKVFKSNFLNSLSKVHYSVPLFIFIPIISFFCYRAFAEGISLGYFILFFLSGLFIWTLTEYVLHRFIFHYQPSSNIGKRLHFIFHGVHHDYPRDAKRLVMPPSASIPLATLFYFIFYFCFAEGTKLYSFFSGFLLGYLCYDMMHYAMHHANFKTTFFKKIKQHHMLHHYDNPSKGYGVSSNLWDNIFQSNFSEKK